MQPMTSTEAAMTRMTRTAVRFPGVSGGGTRGGGAMVVMVKVPSVVQDSRYRSTARTRRFSLSSGARFNLVKMAAMCFSAEPTET